MEGPDHAAASPASLFDCDALREIARPVDVGALAGSDVVGQELEGGDGQDTRKLVAELGDVDDVVRLVDDLAVSLARDGDHLPVARAPARGCSPACRAARRAGGGVGHSSYILAQGPSVGVMLNR